MKTDGLLQCSRDCIEEDISCPNKECRKWIDYEEDNNCCLISINKHDKLTLREVADREGVSFARIKQIEQKALEKLKDRASFSDLFFSS